MSSDLTLHYWGGRGLAEPARVMLAIAGKSFTDARHDAPPATGLDANLGRLPVLDVVVDGKKTVIGQSLSIWYYVASECGLLGDSPLEAAQIICLVKHIEEMGEVVAKAVPWGTAPTPESLASLFDDATATDYSGPADGSKRASRNVLWHAKRLEGIVGTGGFAVGNKISLADVLIHNRFGDSLPEAGNEKIASFMREPLKSLAHTQKLLASCPNLSQIVQNVANHAEVKKWLETRGPQGF